ncbi:MAG: hypothetical protein ACTSVY_04250 [Candidatus Helarchaeota archaeon]
MQVTLEAHLEEGQPLFKNQKNYLNMLAKTFKKHKLELIDQTLYRYDPNKFQQDYEITEEEKELNEKKLDSIIRKKRRKLDFDIKNQVKVILKTNIENVKQLIFTVHVPPSTIKIAELNWTFFYPRPLESNVIWGRYSKKEKHGGGDYYFAPTTFDLAAFFNEQDNGLVSGDLLNEILNLDANELLSSNKYSICSLLARIRRSTRIKNEFKSFHEKRLQEVTDYPFIDGLNSNKKLMKMFLTRLITYGNKVIRNRASFKSSIDINLLAFNYKSGAIVQLSSFASTPYLSMEALLLLIETLNSTISKSKKAI